MGLYGNKYVYNIEDVIMELSEEQLSSMMDSDNSPKNAQLEQFLLSRLSIKKQEARQSIREIRANLLMIYGDRKRSSSFSKQEFRSIKESFITTIRSKSIKTTSGNQIMSEREESSLKSIHQL